MLLGHFGNNNVKFIVHNQDETGSDTSEDVGGGSLEEWLVTTFILVDLGETVGGAIVKDISSTTLHHQPPSDGV